MKRLLFAVASLASVLVAPRASASCYEKSDIVGHERCRRFGSEWAFERYPRFVISLEIGDSVFDPGRRTFDFAECKSCGYHSFPGSALGPGMFEAKGAGLEIDLFLLGPLYLGARLAEQVGTNAIGSVVTDDGVHLAGSSSALTYVSSAQLTLGVRAPLGRVSLRFEGSVGDEFLTLDQTASDGQEGTSWASPWLLLGARGMVDVWATPGMTVSVYGGTNLLDVSERTLGLAVAFHMRSFDGDFAL
jgi:hypothetical protein